MILIQGKLGKVKVTGKKSIKLVSSPYLFFGKTWEFLLKTKKKNTYDLGRAMIYPKVIWAMLRPLEKKSNYMLLYTYLRENLYEFLFFHIKIAYDLKVCHDFSQGRVVSPIS